MKPSLFKRILACFPVLLAPNRDREIGGGRATRQPGQVRKEAALTRSGSGRSSVSYLFFERIAQNAGEPRAVLDSGRIPQNWLTVLRSGCAQITFRKDRPEETINCGSTDERRWRFPR